ncbi:MAG: hypothetical protein BWY47_00246 [Bacteroidetes bacterium ADurb.Bin302]|nr:MAG: hypothetical protein BWY47_00246 [Bacteroidetes bacterium ADurb.Bin302]
MIDRVKLLEVKYLPQVLDSGILYVSKKYGIAGHLCPCGCGNKIITPLGRTEWHLKVKNGKPTLYPSLGNWQLPCKSHYWIIDGEIEWSYQWDDDQIKRGQKAEDIQRKNYFKKLSTKFKRRT